MCGSFVDPSLGEFSAGADWARKQGVRLERVNLATQPMDFVDHPLVKAILGGPPGETSLPVSLVDGQNALIETVRTRYAVGRNVRPEEPVGPASPATLSSPVVSAGL